jgi:anti-anti-sigma regulatory factor
VRVAPKTSEEPVHAVGHLGLVVTSEREYREFVHPVLTEGARLGEKLVVFGAAGPPPEGTVVTSRPMPGIGVLAELRHEVTVAWQQGFQGIRVVATMPRADMLPPDNGDLLSFELELDRAVTELGATMLCVYQGHLFERETLAVAMCAHPRGLGVTRADVGFRIGYGAGNRWKMTGAIDVGNAEIFKLALVSAVRSTADLRLEFADLRFVDLTGLQALVDVVESFPELSLTLEEPRNSFRRCWQMLGYDETCPRVMIVP